MTENNEKPGEGESIELKIFADVAPWLPLTHVAIATHLGIYHYTEANADENLRRAKRFFEVYYDNGKVLLEKKGPDGEMVPFTPEDVTSELIRAHLGQTVALGTHTAESFDDHMLDVVASLTGKPRMSWYHLRRQTPRVNFPTDIYQEVNDKDGSERRRVEVYLDGRHLWVEDNYEGTGEVEKDDTAFPGLDVVNARPGWSAGPLDEAEFETLWSVATEDTCRWLEQGDMAKDDYGQTCSLERAEGQPFCTGHLDLASVVFPRLFETASEVPAWTQQ